MKKLIEDEDRKSITKQWDVWRKAIANGCAGSWPRDAFESLLDSLETRFQELYYENTLCRKVNERRDNK